jgi:hypothetical protein
MRRMLLIKRRSQAFSSIRDESSPCSLEYDGSLASSSQARAAGGRCAGAPGQGDVPVGVGFVQGDQGNAGVLMFVRQHARQEGDAQAGGDQVDDKVDLPAARRDPGVTPLRSQAARILAFRAKPASKRMNGESAKSVKSMRVRRARDG